MTGIQANIVFCIGSVGSGFIFICMNMDTPMISGQMPIHRNEPMTGNVRRIEGQQTEQVEDVCRIGRRQVLDPADEGSMPHFDGDEDHLVEREEDRNLQRAPASSPRPD